jgi:hypothetical protein
LECRQAIAKRLDVSMPAAIVEKAFLKTGQFSNAYAFFIIAGSQISKIRKVSL